MTSAHRPTFDHAKGKEKRVVSSITHKRALTTHSKLKFRNKRIRKNEEFFETDMIEKEKAEKDEIVAEGRRIEGLNEAHILQLRRDLVDDKDDIKVNSTKIEYNKLFKDTANKNYDEQLDINVKSTEEIKVENISETQNENKTESENSNENENEKDEDEEDTDSQNESDSDDEEALLREMELIKKEREEAKKNVEEERMLEKGNTSNPSLHFDENGTNQKEIPKKKSWRNVRTMSKNVKSNELDRFSNDTLKSDFHNDFLDRYIK